MKVEKTFVPKYDSFKDISVGDTFNLSGKVFIRIKHSLKSLEIISGKSEVIVPGGGFAVDLYTGSVHYFTDNAEVVIKPYKVVGDI